MDDIIFVAVTYNQPVMLKALYDSLTNSFGELNEENFYIVNNHSFYAPPGPSRELRDAIRPDYSLGYLPRSWNAGLLHAFKNTESPQVNWVCLVQSDVWFRPDWLKHFRDMTADGTIKLVACGPGDQAVFIHIDAFREIGWFDERFCGIGYHEFDFFLRCYIHLGRRCMIQGHGRQFIWNWPQGVNLIGMINNGSDAPTAPPRPARTSRMNTMLLDHLHDKWGRDLIQAACHDPESAARWNEVLDARFGSPEAPRSREQIASIPREYNWYPYMYMDDSRNYRHLYFHYVQLETNRLFTQD